MNTFKPKYPVYIISKGRYNRRPTARTFEEMNLDYFIVVEKHEYEHYKNVCKGTVLVLPQKYLDQYDTFWNRNNDNKTGPGAARNFCWDHSLKNGFAFHWVFDDNIEAIERFNNNMKIKCKTSTPLYIIEQWVERYENIAISGFGYSIFCPASDARPAIRFNTRIYSALFIKNDIPFRWRGRYNEDTDICLRALKAGFVTAEFNAFLISKRATQTMKGGNTDEFYSNEGTLNKSKMLFEMHPDVTKLVTRWNRHHHVVNYKKFKSNLLKRKEDFNFSNESNEYGLKLIRK